MKQVKQAGKSAVLQSMGLFFQGLLTNVQLNIQFSEAENIEAFTTKKCDFSQENR